MRFLMALCICVGLTSCYKPTDAEFNKAERIAICMCKPYNLTALVYQRGKYYEYKCEDATTTMYSIILRHAAYFNKGNRCE